MVDEDGAVAVVVVVVVVVGVGGVTGEAVGAWVLAGRLLLLAMVPFFAPILTDESVNIGSNSNSKNAASATAATTAHIRIHTKRMALLLDAEAARNSLICCCWPRCPPLLNNVVSSSTGIASAAVFIPSGVIAGSIRAGRL
jgi:hypothetical protein